MALRRSKKFGPIRLTLSRKGLSGSIGTGGVRYQFLGGRKRSRGRRRAPASSGGIISNFIAACVGLVGIFIGGGILIALIGALIGPSSDVAEALPEATAPRSSALGSAASPLVASPSSVVTPPTPIVSNQPTATPPVAPRLHPTRTWTDNTGKHKTEASLADVAGELVYLSRDEKINAVPFKRLSKTDVEYVNELYPFQKLEGRVVGVTDGDTFTLLNSRNDQIKVRVEGLDAPENAQDFGTKSRRALADKIFQKSVVVRWSEKDKYGRTLGHVFVDNKWINLELVSEGWAWHYKEYNQSAVLAKAEEDAKLAKLGLWADKLPIPPWTFRHTPAPIRGPPPTSLVSNSLTQAPKASHPTQEVEQIVYITRTGSKYHSAGCRHLSKSSIPISLSEAQDRYSACSHCGGHAVATSSASRSSSYRPSYSSSSSSYTPPRSNYRPSYGEPVTGYTATGIPIHTGPRGGRYHYSKSGKKVYERRR